MHGRTDELLRNLEGYLIELASCVKSTDEVNVVAEVLGSVQDALKELAPKANLQSDPIVKRWRRRILPSAS